MAIGWTLILTLILILTLSLVLTLTVTLTLALTSAASGGEGVSRTGGLRCISSPVSLPASPSLAWSGLGFGLRVRVGARVSGLG